MRASNRPPCSGLSLLEVIVVLLIAAATCLLLVPVLNQSRENARASYCGNNLRRLEQAVQQYQLTKPDRRFRGLTQTDLHRESTDPSLREARLLKLKSWPYELRSYLEPDMPPRQKGENPLVDAVRPMWLTCPSHPEVLTQTNPSHALYSLVEILVPPPALAASGNRQPDKTSEPAPEPIVTLWKFRDRPRDLPPLGNRDAWIVGPVLSAAEAQQQLQREQGPHANGTFQQSNLTGGPDRLPQ